MWGYRISAACCGLVAGLAGSMSLHGANAETLVPLPVAPSNLAVTLTEVGQVTGPSRGNNYGSPVAIGDDLYFIDQNGRLLRETPTGFQTIIDADTRPEGVSDPFKEDILNIAGRGDHVFVVFTSDTLPDAFDAALPMPRTEDYSGTAMPDFQLLYRYDRNPDGTLDLESAQALTAFEGGNSGHTGGGLLVLPSGEVVFARGDLLRQDFDGRAAPQDDSSWAGQLILIDPETGVATVGAQGVRNPQRLTFTDESQTEIAFVDLGGEIAEEVNVIGVAALLDTETVENFGWGRNADGRAREGGFYINEDGSIVTGIAPIGEAGFLQPYAEFGREDATWFAGTGPVASTVSFSTIDLLFGDLNTGRLMATLGGDGPIFNTVYEVSLVNDDGVAYALSSLLNIPDGGGRADLRFFNFADGGAGVLLEGQGRYYRITQYIAAVPLPAGIWLGLLGIGALGIIRRRTSLA